MVYFTSKKITSRITKITDICGTIEYLVEGDNKACLIDTGNGFGNIRNYVNSLTFKDCFVILTHGHTDHVNGAGLFDEVFISDKDLELYREHSNMERRIASYSKSSATKNIPVSEYNPVRKTPFLSLSDNQRFDLGNVTLHMVSAQGHTQGMTMVLIPEERIMVFGDGCGERVLLHEDYSSTISEYLKTLNKIKKLENDYDKVLCNHGDGEPDKDVLEHVIECCHLILDHKDAHVSTKVFGIEVFSSAPLEPKGAVSQYGCNIIYRFDKAR